MSEIAPVLSIIPPGVRPTLWKKYEPTSDSCDGARDTFGWDPVTVDIGWPDTGRPAQVVAHVEAVMASLHWRLDPSGNRDWVWHRTLSTGDRASAELLGGPETEPPDWALQATAPPATRPALGC